MEYQKSLAANGSEDQANFRQAVLDAKKKDASRRNPYTLGFFSQVKVLTGRQFRLQLQDKFTLYTSFGISWVSPFLEINDSGAYDLSRHSPSFLGPLS